jgi:hypothetical protein
VSGSGGGTFTGGTIASPILAPAANNCASVPYSFTSDATSGMCSSSSGIVDLYSGGGAAARFSANGLFATGTNGVQVNSTGVFSFSSGTAGAAAADLFLYRDAANTLALRNSTNAQKFIWNYSYTDGSNYQQGALKTSASGIEIAAETAGSGADNLDITLTPAGTGAVKLFHITSPGAGTLLIDTQSGYPVQVGGIQTYDSSGNYLTWLIGNQLTTATMTQVVTGALTDTSSAYTWSNAMVVALGAALTGDIKVATLPAKTQVVDAAVVITGTAAGTTTLTVACGRVSAGYIDYIVASDAKVAANTVYGDASGERGTNLTGYDLPSYTGTTDVYCHFISTGANLDQVTGSTGRVILTTRLLP